MQDPRYPPYNTYHSPMDDPQQPPQNEHRPPASNPVPILQPPAAQNNHIQFQQPMYGSPGHQFQPYSSSPHSYQDYPPPPLAQSNSYNSQQPSRYDENSPPQAGYNPAYPPGGYQQQQQPQQQQLDPYRSHSYSSNGYSSGALAPPPRPRAHSYGSNMSHDSYHSHRSSHSRSSRRSRRSERDIDRRPTWGDSVSVMWSALKGAWDKRA